MKHLWRLMLVKVLRRPRFYSTSWSKHEITVDRVSGQGCMYHPSMGELWLEAGTLRRLARTSAPELKKQGQLSKRKYACCKCKEEGQFWFDYDGSVWRCHKCGWENRVPADEA